ncbi:hypothetical protein KP509_26G030400 [Ceratopteris richardii]|nr:hypothetical protein KP509_26G030400 [Ceratopteris richardii]
MYGKCGFIADAEFVFQSLSERVIASWNAMIAVYVDQGHERKALQLFRQMWEDGIGPNKYTFASVLLACGSAIERYDDRVLDGSFSKLLLFEIGQALHAYARNLDLATEPYVITALLNLYGKGGTIKEVENTFTQCLHHDVVLWSSVLYAYVDQGHGVHALLFFQEMQRRGIEPDQHTFVIVLQACGIIAEQEKGLLFEEQLVKVMSLDIARALHNDARRRGFISDSFVCNILINVYGKCGSIKEAEDIFSGMPVRDIVTSTSMLTALVEQGNGYKAFLFYKQMLEEDTMVNDINLLCILQGCVEAGSIEMCRELHFVVASAELDIDIPLAATVMNAYGSCASMVDAEVVLEGLSHPDIVPWSVCIAGHAEGLECFASLRVFEESQCLGICCDEAAFASVIASCSRGGLVDHGLLYFVSLGRNYQITPGVKHYGCVIDLLARAGAFNKVKRILDIMPVNPDLNLLLSLLSACRLHGNVELGQWAFENAVRLQPTQTAAYALMSNMCCDP